VAGEQFAQALKKMIDFLIGNQSVSKCNQLIECKLAGRQMSDQWLSEADSLPALCTTRSG